MGSDRLLWILIAVIATGALLLVINDAGGQTFGMDNTRFASLVTLVALALWIGPRFFRQGVPVGAVLRQAAVWVCIFLAIMVVYQVLARYDMLPENFRDRPVPVEGPNTSADASGISTSTASS